MLPGLIFGLPSFAHESAETEEHFRDEIHK